MCLGCADRPPSGGPLSREWTAGVSHDTRELQTCTSEGLALQNSTRRPPEEERKRTKKQKFWELHPWEAGPSGLGQKWSGQKWPNERAKSGLGQKWYLPDEFDALSRNVTSVSAVGHADLQGPTQVDNHDEPIVSGRFIPWLHADSALCVIGTSVDLAQPTPSVFEAIHAIGDRDVVLTHDASEAEPTGLGARHAEGSQCLPLTLTLAQWYPVRDPVRRATVFKKLHQHNTILWMCPMCRFRARATDRFFSLAAEFEDEQTPAHTRSWDTESILERTISDAFQV